MSNATRIVSAPVGAVSKNAHLWHAVELVNDEAVRVLCGRVKLEHILDDSVMYDAEPINCPICAKRAAKWTK